MSAADILAGHTMSGSTKFIHRNGNSYVEWPKCSCGKWSDHPAQHGQHLLDVLAEAGFKVEEP